MKTENGETSVLSELEEMVLEDILEEYGKTTLTTRGLAVVGVINSFWENKLN